jgi:NAD(P)-dependent dehydrogenase (short-subunit alcohol dehydrogenase family)
LYSRRIIDEWTGEATMSELTGKEKQSIAQTPLGRTGTPEDIAPAVVFLASDRAGWLTGESIRVSGGLQ